MTSAPARITPAERSLLQASRAFEGGARAVGLWQVTSTLAVLGGLTVLMGAVGPWWAWVLVVPWALVAVRVFVLQHDCGHRSLFPTRTENDIWGRILSAITGIAHDGWRVEHDWHHQVTGRLDRRGIDLFNSPLTVTEAKENPARARAVQKKVRLRTIAFLGMLAIVVDRKRKSGFFPYRKGFVWRVDDRGVLVGLWLNNLLHAALHLALAWALGPVIWATAILPAVVLAGSIGALLFWVQHNFEASVVRPGERWSFVEAALKSSSHLRLPQPFLWCTASIGLHHVHHLNAKIPNHRLEEARQALPALRAVPPLSLSELKTAFTHHYFDEDKDRRVTAADLPPTDPPAPGGSP